MRAKITFTRNSSSMHPLLIMLALSVHYPSLPTISVHVLLVKHCAKSRQHQNSRYVLSLVSLLIDNLETAAICITFAMPEVKSFLFQSHLPGSSLTSCMRIASSRNDSCDRICSRAKTLLHSMTGIHVHEFQGVMLLDGNGVLYTHMLAHAMPLLRS